MKNMQSLKKLFKERGEVKCELLKRNHFSIKSLNAVKGRFYLIK